MSAHLTHCPECGCVLGKIRSVPMHRRFFGLIGKAYDQWPHEHEFQPTNSEHLRAWLLVTAGYHDVACVPTAGFEGNPHLLALARLTIEAAMAAALGKGDYAFARASASGVEVLRPKSIAFHALGQKEFGRLCEAVEAIIENAVGVKADQLLREQAA